MHARDRAGEGRPEMKRPGAPCQREAEPDFANTKAATHSRNGIVAQLRRQRFRRSSVAELRAAHRFLAPHPARGRPMNAVTAAPQRRMRLRSFKPLSKGALRGFATVELSNGLIMHDVSLHTKNGKCWAGLPARPQIEKDGRVKQLEGRIQYVRILEFSSRERGDKFSAEVVQLVRHQFPAALN